MTIYKKLFNDLGRLLLAPIEIVVAVSLFEEELVTNDLEWDDDEPDLHGEAQIVSCSSVDCEEHRE